MDVDTTIIGAGVVGLAIAAELADRGISAVVIERHGRFGQEASSHNSEVLHAGLYYPPGSLKARLCVEGAAMIRALGRRGKVPVRLIGKLVVGETSDREALEKLMERGTVNGARDLELLERREIERLEPNVSSSVALFSPHTGILDSHALMRHYLARAADGGVDVAYHTELVGAEPIAGGYRLATRGPDGTLFSLETARVVNAAGVRAHRVAAMAGIDIDAAGYRLHPCKGDYFSTRPACWRLVTRLIYPAPRNKAAGLGIHVTLDLSGRMRLGPDATYLPEQASYPLMADASKRSTFARAAQRYLPAIRESDLEPEFAGIRAKLQGPGEPFRDYIITEEVDRGLPGWVNLIGIESPGLTASPAIAREVAAQMSGVR